MKKYIKRTLVIVILVITLTGCYKNNSLNDKPKDNIYHKDFGSYEVLDGWVENKEHSTRNKFFYVLEGTEKQSLPNNISINEGTNKYSSNQHTSFRTAIVKQLSSQISGKEGVTLNANGSYTDNDYVVYTFVIHEEDKDITTTQYYIVGDYKYVLIHETVHGTSTETDEVAKKMLNTFKWND